MLDATFLYDAKAMCAFVTSRHIPPQGLRWVLVCRTLCPLLLPRLQEEIARLRAAVVASTAEREEAEQRAAEASSALVAAQQLYTVQEQLQLREAELAALQQERATMNQRVRRSGVCGGRTGLQAGSMQGWCSLHCAWWSSAMVWCS